MKYPYSMRFRPSATLSSPVPMRDESAEQSRFRGARLALLLPFFMMLSSLTGPSLAAGNAEAGAAKAWTCLGCHGVEHYVNVYPSYHVPRIAGQNAEYLVVALQAYRSKLRPHPTMQANAGLLSDQDIEDIAAWFSQQGASQ